MPSHICGGGNGSNNTDHSLVPVARTIVTRRVNKLSNMHIWAQTEVNYKFYLYWYLDIYAISKSAWIFWEM